MKQAPDEGAPGEDRDAVDVVVVGSGVAGLSAAITAAEAGRAVVLVDAAPETDSGGNTRYSIGVARVAYDSWDEVAHIGDVGRPEDDAPALPYPVEQFHADLVRASRGQGDSALQRVVARDSAALIQWMRQHGVRWTVTPFRFGRQHPRSDQNGQVVSLPPGAPLFAEGGGAEVSSSLLAAGRKAGVRIDFNTAVRAIRTGPAPAVILDRDGTVIAARSIVLAAGGFDADKAARAKYLGAGWDLVRVRGSRFNTGRVLEAAMQAGAAPAGHWSGVHSVASDPNGPAYGDPAIGDVHGRYSYPYGITVNARGERFFDEGADEKNFTYATVGRHIHEQPAGVAFQLFDEAATELLEPRYATADPVVADTVEELATQLSVPAAQLCRTVREFNDACPSGIFDPHSLDGLSADPVGQPPKSNWAVPLTAAPFRAYRVEPVVSFTFGGLAVDTQACVLNSAGDPIPGLYACGDIVGGIAVHNLPAGTGMIAAGVFGRIAGKSALQDSKP